MPEPLLRVGIDATAAAVPHPTGVGLAIAHLLRALLAGAHELGLQPTALYRWSRLRRRRWFLPGPWRAYHERWSWLLARRLDVFHGPDARLPRFRGPALVATVHDLSARRPGFTPDRFRRLREAHWAAVRERAARVVTYTAAVREELVRELGLLRERIDVVPLAPTDLPPEHELAAARRDVRERLGGGPWVLYLGERSRRKNAAGAALAFEAAGEALRGHTLVFVGPPGHGAEELTPLLERPALRGRVRVCDYLAPAESAALLEGAAALLFPSRYEGFGLPLLEAFRAGVPVVASTDPSLLEVSAGAALHAPAEDADGLAAQLVRAVSDGALRAELVARGRARLTDFGWDDAARRLARTYRAAGSEGHGAAASAAKPADGAAGVAAEDVPCAR